MTAKIRLMVNSGSGVLAAVASQLLASGVRVKSHNLESMNNTSSVLTLDAEANGDIDESDLTTRLSGIGAVQSVEEIRFNAMNARLEPKPGVEIPEELVDRIVAAFPKIMSHIQNYEERIAKDPRRIEKLRQLGVATGAKFAAEMDTGSLASEHEVIDEVILPRISSIAEASRDGSTVVVPVSLFTRRVVTSMDLFSGDDENCYFLCGLIEGMATSASACDSVSVKETRCRANGDPTCVFALS